MGDYQTLMLLCQRALSIAPNEELLHRGIITHLGDRNLKVESMRHVTQLMRTGVVAEWLRLPG